MAAILEPRRIGPTPTPRPALRLVATDGRRVSDVPLDLGLGARHLVAVVVALVLTIALSFAVGGGALASLAPSTPAPAAAGSSSAVEAGGAIAVEPGDTLWSIAKRIQPQGDVRPLVDDLQALNGVGPLQVGQTITLPA